MTVHIVKTSKGQWDSWAPITVAICSTMWEAEKKREEWIQTVKAWENKYSKEEQEKLDKEWEEVPDGTEYLNCPAHLIEYDKWQEDTGYGSEYEKYSEQVDVQEVELDKILYKIDK